MNTAQFSHSKWDARLTLAGILVGGLIALMMLALGLFGSVQMAGASAKTKGVLVAGLGLWMLVSMYQWVRYRYVLYIRYVVAPEGIHVQQGEVSQTILWSGFEAAEYHPLLFQLRLQPNDATRPVVLFLTRGMGSHNGDSRNALALELIEHGMRGRFVKKRAL